MTSAGAWRGPEARSRLRNLRIILGLLGRRGWRLPALIGLGLTASLAEGVSVGLVVTLLYRFLGQPGGGGGDLFGGLMQRLTQLDVPVLAVAVLILLAARTAVTSIYSILGADLSAAAADDVRTGVYAKFLGAPYAYVAERGAGALLNILEWESQAVPETINQLANLTMDACAVAIYGVLIALISWRLALFAVLLAMLLIPLVLLMGVGLNARSERLRKTYERLTDLTVSTIEALRTLRLLHAEDEAVVRQRAASGGVAAASLTMSRLQAQRSPLRKTVLFATFLAFVWLLRSVHLSRELTLAVVALAYRVLPHMTSMEGQILQITRNSAPLRNTLAVLSLPEKARPAHPAAPFDHRFAAIRLEGIGFWHAKAAEPSLVDVNLSLQRGELIAVTGPSGGGKTTLVNLLGQLYAPSTGAILVDGRPLSGIDLADWLRTVAFAGQDVELLTGSILDNIRLGRPELALDEVWEALTLACAADFTRRLEFGLDAQVGDRGAKLSGGQRQRLILARALARRPALLILDEATNAVDPEMERTIYRTIRAARPELTILTVTHRGDTSMADQTVVIDRGRVVSDVRPPRSASRASA